MRPEEIVFWVAMGVLFLSLGAGIISLYVDEEGEFRKRCFAVSAIAFAAAVSVSIYDRV